MSGNVLFFISEEMDENQILNMMINKSVDKKSNFQVSGKQKFFTGFLLSDIHGRSNVLNRL